MSGYCNARSLRCVKFRVARHQTTHVSDPRLFVGDKVMQRVAAALPKRGSTWAAVAYVTLDHLALRHGDALAVNASTSAVRSGATNPSLLLELQARDVIVVNQPMLHAKAIVRGGTVAVGSANLSGRTSDLQELMWVTKDPRCSGALRPGSGSCWRRTRWIPGN